MTENKSAVTTEVKPKTIFDLVKDRKVKYNAVLPKGEDSEKFIGAIITCIGKNKELQKCTAESVLGSVMTAAQLGLVPGTLEQCYLIPYKNKKKGVVECQFTISYKGQIELLRRSGQLLDIKSATVYSNDIFDVDLGINRGLSHKPKKIDGKRGEPIGYYAVAWLDNGIKSFHYMDKEEIEGHKNKYVKFLKEDSPWKTNFNSMAEKTVIKQLLKLLPCSVERLNRQVDQIAAKNYEKASETKEDFIDIEIIEDPDLNVDETTGEIIEDVEVVENKKNK